MMLLRPKRDLTMAEAARAPGGARVDHLLVSAMVEPKSRVLDVGCGDGELLKLLEQRGVDGRGIEISREGVNECVAKGLAVIQGDADTDLVDYPDDAFDYVILSQTLQATRRPREVLENTTGGQVLPPAYIAEVSALARQRGLAMHLDGARMFVTTRAADRRQYHTLRQ